jgi:prevent-host-death family protein
MKTIPLRDAKQQFSECVNQAQKDKILITKHGQPAAIVWGVEGLDFEDVVYLTHPGFWRMIRSRRSSKTIPWRRTTQKQKG